MLNSAMKRRLIFHALVLMAAAGLVLRLRDEESRISQIREVQRLSPGDSPGRKAKSEMGCAGSRLPRRGGPDQKNDELSSGPTAETWV